MFLLAGGCLNSVGVFFPAFGESFRWTRFEVSLVYGSLAVGLGIGSPLAGWLLERSAARVVMGTGVLLSGLGLAVSCLAGAIWPMLGAYCAIGFGLGLSTYVPVSFVISNWFRSNRGRWLGLVMGAQGLGAMIIAPTVGYVISSMGWRAGELVMALPTLMVVLPAVLVFVRESKAKDGTVGVNGEPLRVGGDVISGYEFNEALRTRTFWMLVLIQLGYPLAANTPFVHLVSYLEGSGYTEKIAVLSLALLAGLATVGQIAFGIAADCIGSRFALALSFALTTLSLVALILASRGKLMLVAFLISFGLTSAAGFVLVPMLLADSLGLRRFGTLSGVLAIPFTAGLALGPPGAGWIYDRTGTYFTSFEICIVIQFTCMIAAFICDSERPIA